MRYKPFSLASVVPQAWVFWDAETTHPINLKPRQQHLSAEQVMWVSAVLLVFARNGPADFGHGETVGRSVLEKFHSSAIFETDNI